MPEDFKPFYRVDFRSQARSSYCDNTHSRIFTKDQVVEAMAFAESLKGEYREVLFVFGEGKTHWKFRTVAKWGKKKSELSGNWVIGRIK